jgi:hypothetical protein
MKILPIVFLGTACVTFLLSCNKDQIRGSIEDGTIAMLRFDSTGKNLLDPSIPGYVARDQIKVYHVVDGKTILFFQGNLEAYNGVVVRSVNNDPTSNYLDVMLYQGTTDQEITKTIIKWPGGDADTVQALTVNRPGLRYFSKIWQNSELKYEAGVTQGFHWFGAPFEVLLTVKR